MNRAVKTRELRLGSCKIFILKSYITDANNQECVQKWFQELEVVISINGAHNQLKVALFANLLCEGDVKYSCVISRYS